MDHTGPFTYYMKEIRSVKLKHPPFFSTTTPPNQHQTTEDIVRLLGRFTPPVLVTDPLGRDQHLDSNVQECFLTARSVLHGINPG